MLVNVWNKMKKFRKHVDNEESAVDNHPISNNDIFAEYMKNKNRRRTQITQDTFTDEDVVSSIDILIQNETMEGIEVLSHWSIFNFWEEKKRLILCCTS